MGKLKVLVTGAAGFLGSHLSEKLANDGHKVIGVDNMIGGYQDNIPNNIQFFNIRSGIVLLRVISSSMF